MMESFCDGIREAVTMHIDTAVDDQIINSMAQTGLDSGQNATYVVDSWLSYSLNHDSAPLTFENWLKCKHSEYFRVQKKATVSTIKPLSSPAPSAHFDTHRTPLANLQSGSANRFKTADIPVLPSFSQSPVSIHREDVKIGEISNVSEFKAPDSWFKETLPSTDTAASLTDEKWWMVGTTGDQHPPKSRISVQLSVDKINKFRFMMQRQSDVVLALNGQQQLLEAEAFQYFIQSCDSTALKLELEGVEQQEDDKCLIVGRVFIPGSEEHSTNKGLMLQLSLERHGGREVSVQFADGAVPPGVAIWSGLVIGAFGRVIAQPSISRRCQVFHAERLLLPELTNCIPPISSQQSSGDFVAAICAGPYNFANSDLVVATVASLFKKVTPSLVILVGPFGTALPLLLQTVSVNCPTTTVAIIPCHGDYQAGSPPVYPTPPLAVPAEFSHISVTTPDPGFITVNGQAVISATSIDVLKQLASSEMALPPRGLSSGGDRLVRLSSAVLTQRCLYPLYPQSASTPVDWPLWRAFSTFEYLPNLVITPSDLNPFIAPMMQESLSDTSVLRKVVVCNPGKLQRRRCALARWSSQSQAFIAGRIVKLG